MVRLVRILLLLPAVLLAVGQAHSADDKMLTSPYFPLAVGTTWHYRVGENHYSVKVAKHEQMGKLMCAKLEMFVNKKLITSEHVAVTKNAIVRVAFDGKLITPPIPFFELPPKQGDNWKSWKVESKLDGQMFKGTLKAGEQKDVKVLAKTYPTAVTVTGQDLEVHGSKMNLTYVFVEKVGMVQQVIEMAGHKVVIELEKVEDETKK